MPGKSGQPRQNLGGPWATMCYFTVQFEKFSERTENFWEEERQRKEAIGSVFGGKTSVFQLRVMSAIHFPH